MEIFKTLIKDFNVFAFLGAIIISFLSISIVTFIIIILDIFNITNHGKCIICGNLPLKTRTVLKVIHQDLKRSDWIPYVPRETDETKICTCYNQSYPGKVTRINSYGECIVCGNLLLDKPTGGMLVKHVHEEGSRYHVKKYDTNGVHCSDPFCEINYPKENLEKL